MSRSSGRAQLVRCQLLKPYVVRLYSAQAGPTRLRAVAPAPALPSRPRCRLEPSRPIDQAPRAESEVPMTSAMIHRRREKRTDELTTGEPTIRRQPIEPRPVELGETDVHLATRHPPCIAARNSGPTISRGGSPRRGSRARPTGPLPCPKHPPAPRCGSVVFSSNCTIQMRGIVRLGPETRRGSFRRRAAFLLCAVGPAPPESGDVF
jgi:hypothetical protein